ncbi:MAG: N-acetylmuramoyl-L-alanine amidase [Neomegalonema sp.]|nr:N-acetylmuramoyl-L-alanine amidase [Neomegalonema sp.]
MTDSSELSVDADIGRRALLREPDAHPCPSPNIGARRNGRTPSLVMIHYTNMTDAPAALEWLCNPASQVSAHYLIDLDGALYALAPEEARAWHAGVGSWRGEEDVNSASIGIELANLGLRADSKMSDASGPETYHPFPEPQMNRLERLLASLASRWGLGPDAVIAHSDAAPERKRDPGEKFDWARLERRGLAIGPGAAREVVSGAASLSEERGAEAQIWARFIAAAQEIGYGAWKRDALLQAFRSRFSPSRLDAPFGADDMAAAEAVAHRLREV